MNMRLLGTPTIADVGPELVDASNIHSHIVSVPSDRLFNENCALLCLAPLLSASVLMLLSFR